MTFHELNILPVELLKEQLFKCCGSTTWVNRMVKFFPMDDLVEMMEDAEEQWYLCNESDWLEAFSHHPAIGDIDSVAKESNDTDQWAAGEQKGVYAASPAIIAELAAANEAYENKFGYIFIVSASGKTAEAMLSILQQRLSNAPEVEIKIAMDEQIKITQIRLQKLII